MRKLWQRYAGRVDAMSVRERGLVFGAAAMLLLTVLYTGLLETEMGTQRRLKGLITQKQAEAKTLEAEMIKLATSRSADPDRPVRERLAAARKELAEIDQKVAAEERKFTAPKQMKAVIAEMLGRHRAVQLAGMKTLPTTTIAEARATAKPDAPRPAAKPPAAERLIYRHGLELTVTGAYLDLLAYLGELEKLPTQLYWGSLDLDASRYPRHTLKVVVYTLSLDPAWLSG